jgi:hypothetical protein
MVASFVFFFMATFGLLRTIPNRWLSVCRLVGPARKTQEVGEVAVISLGLGLEGYAAEAPTRLGRRLRWGRSTDAEGDGDMGRLLPDIS